MAGMAPRGALAAGGGMQNPYPSERPGELGNRIAGGMVMAVPGAMTGLAVAGGIHGMFSSTGRSPLDIFDPFTQGARGFARGAGAAGMGFGDTLGVLGNAFRTGGVRAGLGALGGGLAGAAIGAAPIMAAGLAVQQVAGSVYQGVQNISDVGSMANQYFGPQFGAPGARAGGEMGRQTIKGIVGALGEMAGDDIMGSMKELKNLMDRAGQMGLLTGITDVQSFKQRFGQVVSQVRDLAKVMGTTLEEAAPAYMQMRQMGLWKTSDILGTAIASKAVGPQAAPQMMQTMAVGAQLSHAMGGTRRAGATIGRESFLNIQAAQRAGVLSAEDVEEFTGGLTGEEGQAALAQRMGQITSNLMNTSAGRAMMVGLGETREGVFTGGIDKKKLGQFLSGGVGVDELMRQGRKSASGNEAAMSFMEKEGQIGQNLAAEGGIESMVAIVQKIADTRFRGSERARHHLFKQMLGVSSREAEMLGKMADDLPRIMDEKARQMEAAMSRAFDEHNTKTYNSLSGLKGAFDRAIEDTVRPINEIGEKIATETGDLVDRISNTITGRVRKIPMGVMERSRLLREGALTADFSKFMPADGGQNFVTGSAWENMTRRLSSGDWIGKTAAGVAAGGITGGLFGAVGSITGIGEEMTPKARALRTVGIGSMEGGGPLQMGGGFTTSQADVELGIRQAYIRAQGGKEGLGINENRLSRVKSVLSRTIGRHSYSLSKVRKADPGKYKEEVLRLMSSEDRDVFSGMSDREKLNYLSVAQTEEGFYAGDASMDFKSDAAAIGIPTDIQGLKENQENLLSEMRSELGGKSLLTSILSGIGGGGSPVAGSFSRGAQTDTRDSGVTEGDLEKAFGGPGSDIFAKYLKGDLTAAEANTDLARIKGGGDVSKIINQLEHNMTPERREKFKGLSERYIGARGAQVQMEELKKVQGIAASGPDQVEGLGKESGRAFSNLVRLYRGGADEVLETSETTQAGAEAENLARGLSKDEMKALRSGGAIGRQVLALRAGMDVGSMSRKELASFEKKMKGLGYDLEAMGGDDYKKVKESGDLGKFKDLVSKITKGNLSEPQGTTNRLEEQLRMYTLANTRFVEAVGKALNKDVKEFAKEIASQGTQMTANAPAPAKA
jgi:hypothetical protein